MPGFKNELSTVLTHSKQVIQILQRILERKHYAIFLVYLLLFRIYSLITLKKIKKFLLSNYISFLATSEISNGYHGLKRP